MLILEIALLFVGAVLFVISFVIPVRIEESSEDLRDMVREEVRSRVSAEIDSMRSHVDDVVDEAITYAQEKTERSLERLTNEKIMAVNEYSETVLAEIHKNHEEVMFLYDMLNDKHNALQNAALSAQQIVKDVELASKEAEARIAEAAQKSAGSAAADVQETSSFATSTKDTEEETGSVRTLSWAAYAETEAGSVPSPNGVQANFGELEQAFDAALRGEPVPVPDDGTWLNDEILRLYEEGFGSVEIARRLNIGVGEVDLIIGLHGGKH